MSHLGTLKEILCLGIASNLTVMRICLVTISKVAIILTMCAMDLAK